MAETKRTMSKDRAATMVQPEMRPRYSSTNGTSAPGAAARPGSSKASETCNPRSGTPTSISNQQAYDRAFGNSGSPTPPAIKRGY